MRSGDGFRDLNGDEVACGDGDRERGALSSLASASSRSCCCLTRSTSRRWDTSAPAASARAISESCRGADKAEVSSEQSKPRTVGGARRGGATFESPTVSSCRSRSASAFALLAAATLRT